MTTALLPRTLTGADWQAIARNLGAVAGADVFDRIVAAHRETPAPGAVVDVHPDRLSLPLLERVQCALGVGCLSAVWGILISVAVIGIPGLFVMAWLSQ